MRIQTLPENLVARIAAGEVVERPVSIVKELVENSLDARSRRIVVEVESGGKKAIRVTDDGHGMEAADVQAAFQRHATSKIRNLEDLMEISTMGFRGEALPSIAAVSRVRMRSATSPSGIGSLLLVEHGVIGKISEVSASQGTGVEVTGLFEKIPVRKKFLRSVPTELAHITNLLHRFALVRPETSFRLVSDGKPILEAPGVPRFRDRVRQVFGDRFLDVMIPLKVEDGELRLHGFVSRPDSHHSSRTRQSFFVNHRLIRDRTLSHAIQEAYERILPARRFPAVLIFLDMPPAEVDVNIHPAKTEVRFRDPSRCHDMLFNGIRDLLAAIKPFAPLLGSSGRPEPDSFTKIPDRLREATDGFFQSRESILPETAGAPGPGRLEREPTGSPVQAELEAPPIRSLAQYRDSFIIGCDAEGLLVVDQHAAHERILYERCVAGFPDSETKRQQLLFPKTLELTATQMVAFESAAEEISSLGYRLEPFGNRGILIREIPAVADVESISTLLADLLTEVGRHFGKMQVGTLREKLAVTTACHAAVKIHQPLGRERMNYLLRELFQTSSPMTCPHGRPAVLRISHEELLVRFRRR